MLPSEEVVSEFDTAGEFPPQPEDKLARLNELVDQLGETEALCQGLEENLSAARALLQELRTKKLPDLMTEMQIENITHNGISVELTEFVSGSLPKEPERRAAALAWLEANGASGLIKTDVSVSFGRSQHDEALRLARTLEGEGLPVDLASGVHSQTLLKFARERLAAGEPLDLEVLNLFTGKLAKTKNAKKK